MTLKIRSLQDSSMFKTTFFLTNAMTIKFMNMNTYKLFFITLNFRKIQPKTYTAQFTVRLQIY